MKKKEKKTISMWKYISIFESKMILIIHWYKKRSKRKEWNILDILRCCVDFFLFDEKRKHMSQDVKAKRIRKKEKLQWKRKIELIYDTHTHKKME